jgi:hypothetical protein
MFNQSAARTIALVLAVMVAAACGSNTSPKVATATPSAQASEPPGTVPASGDIPDNVVWLTYSGSGFSMQYPEGWVSNTTSTGATFNDKDSHITVVLSSGPAPTKQSVTNEIAAINGAKVVAAAHTVALPTGTAIKVSYDMNGPVNPVTGKQPRLNIDRYEITSSGRVAVLDLAAQVGIDNVDAYLAIAKSFKWKA